MLSHRAEESAFESKRVASGLVQVVGKLLL